MQQYLRQIKKDGKLINVSDLSHDELVEFMNKQMETALKDQMGKDYRAVEPKILEQMLDYAAKFKEYLIKTHGENARFYTEYSISGKVNKINSDDPEILMGSIDLLVVDEDGRTHIYDYKASPKPYSKFDSAKRRAFYH
jgi:ATP-dependent exoDNAse (exonuclease V) beta subunit